MSRRRTRCTEADLRKAMKLAGENAKVRVLPDGTIEIVPIHPQESPSVPAEDGPVLVF